MHIRTSQSAEDYLKAIYAITRQCERASTSEVAARMGVSPASATGMIQKLAGEQPPLLDYEKHHGAMLTPAGEQAALEMIRHHRLLETFLHEKLGFAWDEVHEEADRLEHVISEELEERIAQALGDPGVDPHGEPIPSREFHMPDQSNLSLQDLHPGDRAAVTQIKSSSPELLRYLASIGLTISSRITVVEVSPFDGNTTLQMNGLEGTIVLGPRVTGEVFVRLAQPETAPAAEG
jgi:DtxR family transcriptional regulator, Mn-dependent transcriptional regulator